MISPPKITHDFHSKNSKIGLKLLTNYVELKVKKAFFGVQQFQFGRMQYFYVCKSKGVPLYSTYRPTSYPEACKPDQLMLARNINRQWSTAIPLNNNFVNIQTKVFN